jgi:hypothetical protein
MYFEQGACYVQCGDGGVLRVLACTVDGVATMPADLERLFGARSIGLPSALARPAVRIFSRQANP